jgi:hypothetical protein
MRMREAKKRRKSLRTSKKGTSDHEGTDEEDEGREQDHKRSDQGGTRREGNIETEKEAMKMEMEATKQNERGGLNAMR